MKLTEHIARQLQATILRRVDSQSASIRQQLITQFKVDLDNVVRDVVAQVLAEAADVVVAVDVTTGTVMLETGQRPTPPVVEPPTPPVVDSIPPIDPPVDVPADLPANPGRGGA